MEDTPQYRRALIEASKQYLTAPIAYGLLDMLEEDCDEFLTSHAWQPFANDSASTIWGHITQAADVIIDFAHAENKLVAIKRIRELMSEFRLGVVTHTNAIESKKLICEPVIWQTGDILKDPSKWPKGYSGRQCLSAFYTAQGAKTLHCRSVEEGQQILTDVISLACTPLRTAGEDS